MDNQDDRARCAWCGGDVPNRRFKYCGWCRATIRLPSGRRRDAKRPSTVERGYGSEHQRLRAAWARKVEAGEVNCWRCKRLIVPGTPWDLGHDDKDRSIYRGPEHAACNRATASHKANATARRRSRDW